MRDDNENESRMKRTAEVFYKNLFIAHIQCYDGSFYNGRIFNLFDDYLEVHDRKIGLVKVPYSNIRKIVEFVDDKKEKGGESK